MLLSSLRKSNFIKQIATQPRLSYVQLPQRLLHKGSDKWQPWEDDLLRNYVKCNGKKWNEIVQHILPNRTPNQCLLRWQDILNPKLVRGPFSASEKELLEKGVSTLGVGQWSKISWQYLPNRSPRRIANEWSNKSTIKPWTKEEDELLLKGVAEFGQAWSQIATRYLPWRNRVQIRHRYRSQLDPNVNKSKWTESELDLLLRRTLVVGQDWNRVAEGLPGRTPEDCSAVWMRDLDPTLNKGPWSDEETRMFWERMQKYEGNFVKVAEGLPGRNRLTCFRKFRSIVYLDEEFKLLHGDLLKKDTTDNGPAWRARIAKLVCDWLDQNTTIRQSTNKSIDVHKAGSWAEEDLLKLNELVIKQLEKKVEKVIQKGDWKKISNQFEGRDPQQCQNQYEEHLFLKSITKGGWSKEEDVLLTKLVKEYGLGWNKITPQIPSRNKRQCIYRWHRVLQYNNTPDQPILKHNRLSDTEKSLIREGVQMFGHNWPAIRMTYLPTRTPEQIMQWWNHQKDKIEGKMVWTEDEDKALQFAVDKYKDELGEISSWSEVSKMIHGRTPKQCRTRWLYTLKPEITKGPWSYEEEMQLLEIIQKVKYQRSKTVKKSIWPLVAKELNTGRSDWACRSKYNRMQRTGHRFVF